MTSRALLVALIALSLAASAGAWLHLRSDRERVAALERELAAGRDAAAAAAAERSALADRVTRLETALAATKPAAPFAQADAGPPAAPVHAPSTPDAEGAEAPPRLSAAADLGAAMPQGEMEAFDADRLIAAGFRRQDIDRFRARLDEIQMKSLYLRDRATREGWIDTPRFAQESQAVTGELTGLRSEFDDSLYDWVLYSTGHPNRVAVRDVLAGSPGESAGLQQGDVIVRYDDQLMLSAADLRDATTMGRAGELVAIEVQRAGEAAPRRIFVPRGPIGITLAPTAQQPAPAG